MTDSDKKRLEALEGFEILDTAAEPIFDDVVALAKGACAAPIALVSLLADDRQWFKAVIGLGIRETPIDQSVCRYALESDGLLVIPDLTKDPRTADNPLVTNDPALRFYAGAKLVTPEGVAVGSLCVIDTVPRPDGLSVEQADTLMRLARQTMVMMAFRRAMIRRDEALVSARETDRLSRGRADTSEAANVLLQTHADTQQSAQEAGGIGTFEIDTGKDRCRVSAEFCRVFGLPLGRDASVHEVQTLVIEADRGLITTETGRRDGVARREVEFRIRRANDGAIRWISRRSDFRFDTSGKIVSMVGVVQDITDRKAADTRASALIQLGDILRDAEKIAEVEEAASRILGETLVASRAVFASVDPTGDNFRIDRDWTAPGVPSLAGLQDGHTFRRTFARMKSGVPVAVANVPATDWLAEDRDSYAALQVRALIKVPLLERGRLVGLLAVHSGTSRYWEAGETSFVLAVADRAYAAIAKLNAEEHQRVLNLELSHRIKNTLSMVQALANQTLRDVADRSAVQTLEARIIALSKAHDVLLQQNWSAANFATVLDNVLGLHDSAGRIDLSGPNVTLGPKATLSVSLLLHELATNAVKYGALSVEGGKVEIDWQIVRSGSEPELALAWRERGGPPAAAPARRGFGSRLISLGLVGSRNAELDYGPQGLEARFRATMRSIGDV